jgi:hypothetical protein
LELRRSGRKLKNGLPKGWSRRDRLMETKFIDTDIFLRYLTKENPSKYEKCKDSNQKKAG